MNGPVVYYHVHLFVNEYDVGWERSVAVRIGDYMSEGDV